MSMIGEVKLLKIINTFGFKVVIHAGALFADGFVVFGKLPFRYQLICGGVYRVLRYFE